jgi:hypothetical protein
MDWLNHSLTLSNVINLLVVLGVFTIRSELNHIRESIDNAKEAAIEAKDAAKAAHNRIDFLLKHGMHD